MKSEQSDVVLRVIEQLAGVLRHLVEQLGLGAPAAAEVVREAKAAQGELLGPLSAGLANVDAAMLLGMESALAAGSQAVFLRAIFLTRIAFELGRGATGGR